MIEIIGRPAMLEQMAEECSELTQALLKEARVLRGENPTPVTEEEAEAHVREEWTDVMQCALELKLEKNIDWEQMEAKTDRFFWRVALMYRDDLTSLLEEEGTSVVEPTLGIELDTDRTPRDESPTPITEEEAKARIKLP